MALYRNEHGEIVCSCGCRFFHDSDYQGHKAVCKNKDKGWRDSSWGNNVKIKPSKEDLALVKIVIDNQYRWTPIGNFEYNLSMNGDWLKRRPAKLLV